MIMILDDRNHETIIDALALPGTLFTMEYRFDMCATNGHWEHSRRGKNYTKPLVALWQQVKFIPRLSFSSIDIDQVKNREEQLFYI